jgi:hypothetical protein
MRTTTDVYRTVCDVCINFEGACCFVDGKGEKREKLLKSFLII